jgi:hypothetical protein
VKHMIAFFRDDEERDKAVAASSEESHAQITFVGSMALVLNGKLSTEPQPAIVFNAHGPLAPLFFMRHGAGSCMQL